MPKPSKMYMKSLDELITGAKNNIETKKIVIASAEDEFVLQAIRDFQKFGNIEPVLIGDKNKIRQILESSKIKFPRYEVYSADNELESAQLAVEFIKTGKGDMLMKGLLPTKVFIKEILNKKTGINTSGYFSHVGLFESPFYPKLFGLSDAAINIVPDVETKKYITRNAVEAFHKLGITMPKVALLAPIEKVNSKMQSTLDAAKLVEIHTSEPIADCTLEGPLALDIAISATAAEHKGFKSKIAGQVDILIVPEITSGNVFYKSLTYLGNAKAAGILLGADAPVVLSSRTDSPESKLYSLALAYKMCNRK